MRPESMIFLALVAACAATHPAGAPSERPAVAEVPAADASAGAAGLPAPSSPKTPAEPFGGERWGFVEASSANQRIVVLRRFKGESAPTFGHHGESSVGSELTLFDLARGSERSIDEVIDVAGRRRFLLVEAGKTVLLDAVTGATRELATDRESDDNRCLPPRQATFSASGKRVAWVESGSTSLRVRDLESGEEWSVRSAKRIWRGWPEDDGRGVVLAEIDPSSRGWPVQNTSCACRWCNRFALSYGFYGFAGPAFQIQRVAGDGTRSDAEPKQNQDHWHGKSESECELTPSKPTKIGLERGPWRWVCGNPDP